MFDIPCVLFAGGKSSRMGEDKALLPFGSFSTLTEYQHTRLSKIFKNLFISCKNSSKFSFSAEFILDDANVSVYAPTSGFIASFKKLQTDRFFAISVDTPFIGLEEIRQLIEADLPHNDATIAKTSLGTHPLCGIYHASLLDSFLEMQKENNHKLGYLLKQANTSYVTFENENAFLNLNHSHEYIEALKQLS